MIVLLAIVLLALAAPAVASAQGGGTDEYVEEIPGAGGNTPSETSGDDSSDSSDSTEITETDETLTPSQEEGLEEQGGDGSAAAELAQVTGPDGGGGDSGRDGSGNSGSKSGSDAGSGLPNVVGDVASGADDSGMGVLLPIVIGATVVAALAFLIVRRRRLHAVSSSPRGS